MCKQSQPKGLPVGLGRVRALDFNDREQSMAGTKKARVQLDGDDGTAPDGASVTTPVSNAIILMCYLSD